MNRPLIARGLKGTVAFDFNLSIDGSAYVRLASRLFLKQRSLLVWIVLNTFVPKSQDRLEIPKNFLGALRPSHSQSSPLLASPWGVLKAQSGGGLDSILDELASGRKVSVRASL